MKKLLDTIIIITVIASTCFGQEKFQNGVSYTNPLKIDTSNYYLTGNLIKKSERNKFNLLSNNGYYLAPIWTNVYIFNPETKSAIKMFSNSLNCIYSITTSYPSHYTSSRNITPQSAILKNCILFSVKTDEYNKDGVIDEDDPVSLFITTKSGENLTRITPADMNVTGWSSDDKDKKLFVMLQKDKNGDKKFTDEDEVLYIIDLNEDFSKIKMTPINLP